MAGLPSAIRKGATPILILVFVLGSAFWFTDTWVYKRCAGIVRALGKCLNAERYQDQEFAFAFFWLALLPGAFVVVSGMFGMIGALAERGSSPRTPKPSRAANERGVVASAGERLKGLGTLVVLGVLLVGAASWFTGSCVYKTATGMTLSVVEGMQSHHYEDPDGAFGFFWLVVVPGLLLALVILFVAFSAIAHMFEGDKDKSSPKRRGTRPGIPGVYGE